ncbi:hypothetical protein IGI04_034288, partial [Brassica rapa subsp. trilocularis]
MASSSSSSSSSSRRRTWRYRVFTSFHGPDVRKTFLSHLRKQFNNNGISMDKESEMIEKIARDVSNKLNTTISNDFEDMVGIEGHLEKMQSLLHLDDEDGVMLVGICGPVGIGKTTIARALHSRLSSTFQHSCFMENLRGSCNNGLDVWAPYGFENLAERATELCSNLPLGLCIIGSNLRGKKEEDWESILHRLENSSIPKIDAVLRVGFDSLHENDQTLFLLIAFFFNYKDDGYVKTMLADSGLDVRLGLKTLVYKSLIHKSSEGTIAMHKLLQQVCRQAIQRQEPWKRQILVDTDDILHVLKKDYGNRSLMGISFDISTIKDSMDISPRTLKRKRNLQFLRIYNTRRDTNVRVHVPENIDFPPRLKLLHWEEYPGKCLPHTLRPEHIVELNLENSKLRHLWDGTQ